MQKPRKQKTPTVRESLASISKSLEKISNSLDDNNGDCALASMVEALWDISEYGPGQAPKGHYDWRHGKSN